MVIRKNTLYVFALLFLMGLTSLLSIIIKGDFMYIGLGLSSLFSIGIFILCLYQNMNTIRTFVLLMVMSIFLTPSLDIFGTSLRFEDFLVIFVTIALTVRLFFKDVINNKLTRFINYYILLSVIVTVLHYFTGDIKPIYFLFLLKEIQFFIYFYVFMFAALYIEKLENQIYKILFLMGIINIAWGLYQIIFGAKGYYGIGIINTSAPSQSGGVFLIITLFMLFYKNYIDKKWQPIVLILTIVSGLLTVATISRTALLALSVTLFLYYLFKLVIVKKTKIINLLIYMVSCLVASLLAFKINLFEKVLHRVGQIDSGASIRTNKWNKLIEQANPSGFEWLFGQGKGYTQELTGGLTLAADSQYVRLLLEIGIVGVIFWASIVVYLISFALKNMKHHYYESVFLILLITGFLTMGVTHEVFLVTLQASAFWSVTGLMVGVIMKKNKELGVVQIKPKKKFKMFKIVWK